MVYNKITLKFEDEKEKLFLKSYFFDSLSQLRLSLVIGAFLYSVFGFLDTIMFPEYSDFFHQIRYVFVLPFLCLVFFLTYTKIFLKLWQYLLTISFIIAGAGISVMLWYLPDNYAYYSGLMLTFFAGYFFIKLRFIYATLGGWILLLIFNIGAIYFTHSSFISILNTNFFFISANIIGMLASYNNEFFARRNFYLNIELDKEKLQIKLINSNLEKTIEERTSELLIAKEAAETIRANVTAIIEGTQNSIWAFDKNYDIIYVNHTFQSEFQKTFNVKLDLGVNLVNSLPELLRPIWIPRYDRVLNNEHFTIEDAVETENGLLYIEITFNPIINHGQVIGGSCFGSNITERKQAELELKASREQLRNFASHLQRVREKERVSITLEIHDSIAQFLVALKMDIGVFRNKLLKGNYTINKETIVTEMEQFIKKTENTIKSTRDIMNGLRPDQLELLGFVETAEHHLNQFEENHHLKCLFENTVQNLTIDKELELALFRILQETLTNILKHAMASKITVRLAIVNGNLIFEIVDNGVGFDLNNCGRPDSYGLIGMKELMTMLGGNFEIKSTVGEGTLVRVEMPYND